MKPLAVVLLMLGLCAASITVRALGFPADEVHDWDQITGFALVFGAFYLIFGE